MWFLGLDKDKTAKERKVVICIFDDIVEEYIINIILPLLEACNDKSPDVRQVLCAGFGGSAFKNYVGEAISRLDVVIGHPNKLDLDRIMPYDKAVSHFEKFVDFIVVSIVSCVSGDGNLVMIQEYLPSFCLHVFVLNAFLPKSLNPSLQFDFVISHILRRGWHRRHAWCCSAACRVIDLYLQLTRIVYYYIVVV
ncbi:hypothetical protein DCAR_0418245 [Daucus carota subsp. sativus]|uniref:Uncharacterized protein n=1 Tax=Daucus carota subsp. sativus TaxID=79200 RepID=A0AAF0X0M6_DAUCS|nr:hypothetical protein DCAR_0418245 [Daucus carota subsp. sativus]